MIYLASILVLILVLIMPIEFRIENKVHRTRIKIRLAYMFTFYFDYSKFIKRFVTSKGDRDDLSIREVIENIRKLRSVYPMLECLGRHMTAKEFRVINRYNDENAFVAVANYTTNAYISNYIHGYFGRVLNEDYILTNESEFDVDFLCISSIRLVNILIVLIEHFNKIPLLIKRTT